jgi:hypothetical protein
MQLLRISVAEAGGGVKDVHDLAVVLVVPEVAQLELLKFGPGLQQLLVDLLHLHLLLLAHLHLRRNSHLQLPVLDLQLVRLLNQVVDVALDLAHLVVHEPHLSLLIVAVLEHLTDRVHLLCMNGLHFLEQTHDHLSFLLILVLLLLDQLLIVVVHVLQPFLKRDDVLSRNVLDSVTIGRLM